MSQTYITKDGDILDYIVWIQYPDHPQMGTVEQVLRANPGLARLGPILPQGVTIILPDIDKVTRPVIKLVKFWN